MKYNIKLSENILKKAAYNCEKPIHGCDGRDSESLMKARWAYEKLNYKEKLRGLEEKIQVAISHENRPSLE